MNVFTRTLVATAGLAATLATQVILAAPASAAPCFGKTINATHSNQVIHGTCGNDTINVGQYFDVTIHAGSGDDEVRGGFQATVTTVYLGEGNDEVTVGGSGRLRAYGEKGNDTLVGGNGDDGLYGGIGDDYIEGRNGSNYLGGDSGNDTINADSTGVLKTDFVLGGTGFDKATVDSGVDQVYDVEKVTNA